MEELNYCDSNESDVDISDNLNETRKSNTPKQVKTLIFFGSNEVGKTSLLLQLTKNKFEKNHQTTIGVNYYVKEIKETTLSIWDTCGTELSMSILPQHLYKTTSLFIIVSSYDNFESLLETKKYIDIIKRQQEKFKIPKNQRQPIVSLINKKDIKDKKFSLKQAFELLREHFPAILMGEICCKDNAMVIKFFEKIVEFLRFNQNVTTVENGAKTSMDFKRGSNIFFSSNFKINESFSSSNNIRTGQGKSSKKCC